jgi:excisionase family DNA binding protein
MEVHYSIFEVSQITGLSREFLRQRLVRGELRGFRAGVSWRIPYSELLRLTNGDLGKVPGNFTGRLAAGNRVLSEARPFAQAAETAALIPQIETR